MNTNKYQKLLLERLAVHGVAEGFARKELRSALWSCLWAVLQSEDVVEALVMELKKRQAEEKMVMAAYFESQGGYQKAKKGLTNHVQPLEQTANKRPGKRS
jgi:hypothetical protein